MSIKLRELKGDDLFLLLGIVGKLDIKDEFIAMFEENSKVAPVISLADHKDKKPTKAEQAKLEELARKQEEEAEKRGMQVMANLMQKVLLNAGKLKTDINALLSDLSGEPLKNIQELGLLAYTKLIVDFFKKEELKDFFISIASLLK